jgi:hypothetical protein
MDDNETKNILTEQQLLSEVTSHQGWGIVRRIFAEKIESLQNAFNIDTATPTIMLRDLQASKKATEILWKVLEEIEGAKDVVVTQKVRPSYIVDIE